MDWGSVVTGGVFLNTGRLTLMAWGHGVVVEASGGATPSTPAVHSTAPTASIPPMVKPLRVMVGMVRVHGRSRQDLWSENALFVASPRPMLGWYDPVGRRTAVLVTAGMK